MIGDDCCFIFLDICPALSQSSNLGRLNDVFYYFNALHQSHSTANNINGQFLIKLQLIVFFRLLCCSFVFFVTFK